MMGPMPQCFIPSHNVIDPLVLEKCILKVFAIYGYDGHLGHVTLISATVFRSQDQLMFHDFRSTSPWRPELNFSFDWPSGLDETIFEEGYWADHGRKDARVSHLLSRMAQVS